MQETALQMAQRLLANRQPFDALKIVDNILDKRPDHWSALMRRAKIIEWLGRFSNAREIYLHARASGANPEIVDKAIARIDAVEKLVETGKELISEGRYEQASAVLNEAGKRRSSSIVELYLAQARLAAGDSDEAEHLISLFLDEHPDHKLAQTILSKAVKANRKTAGKGKPRRTSGPSRNAVPKKDKDPAAAFLLELPAHLSRIIKSLEKDGAHGPVDIGWLGENAKYLSMVNWANDIEYATAAHFAFSASSEHAIQNYHAHLIAKSVEYGYITWPRRIQEYVKGRSVLDVGCGFGAFGNGFLVAGAKSYVGIDPQMPLDSSIVKNKRKRKKADLGLTPNEIMQHCPDIKLINGLIEDLETKDTFDSVVMHNVTEHLQNIRKIIPNIRKILNPDGYLIYHHHNFYCWNGHHMAPNRPEHYVPGLEKHDKVVDWNHILAAPHLPDDHYFNTNLNQIRLDEIKDVTESNYEVIKWLEIESPHTVADRLNDEILDRIRDFDNSLTRRDLMVNAVLCVATPKKGAPE
ncbi:MAG: methyltransferase domain-containing protein [Pseudomonadota bacterium]